MSISEMPQPDTQARDVLALFATYGVRKTSMGEIAAAAGLSRQSIYNQHGSKAAVLDWAVSTFLGEITDRAVAALGAEGAPEAVLAAGFRAWVGDHVEMLRGTPHGGALLETAIAAATQSAAEGGRDYEGAFAAAVTAVLDRQGLAGAEDRSFVLQAASKGLLLKCRTAEAYSAGMARVVAVVLSTA